MLRTATLPAILFVLGLTAATGRAQPAPKTLEETGKVKEVDGTRILLETPKFEVWWIQFAPATKLHVEGTAELSYLRPGLAVRFSGEFDKKNALQEDIKEIEIFSPQGKNGLGFFADSGAEKPLKSAPAGSSYEIRGKLASLKDNEFSVTVGTKKLTGKMADDVAIKINVDDPKEIRSGDAVKVTATYYDAQKGNATNPGQATGEDVVVTLQKPLAGLKKKGPAKVAKAPKEKKEKKGATEAGDGSPLAVSDPFGVDGQKQKDDDEMKDDKPKAGKKTTKKPAKDEDE